MHADVLKADILKEIMKADYPSSSYSNKLTIWSKPKPTVRTADKIPEGKLVLAPVTKLYNMFSSSSDSKVSRPNNAQMIGQNGTEVIYGTNSKDAENVAAYWYVQETPREQDANMAFEMKGKVRLMRNTKEIPPNTTLAVWVAEKRRA